MRRTHPLVLILAAFTSLPFALSARATPTEYVCAARVDCGAPRLPSTQELPTVSTPIVRSETPDRAREKCMSRYSSSYQRLARSIATSSASTSILLPAKSCEILSEVLPVTPTKKD